MKFLFNKYQIRYNEVGLDLVVVCHPLFSLNNSNKVWEQNIRKVPRKHKWKQRSASENATKASRFTLDIITDTNLGYLYLFWILLTENFNFL